MLPASKSSWVFNYKTNQISSPEVRKEQRSEGFQFNYPHYNFIPLSYLQQNGDEYSEF